MCEMKEMIFQKTQCFTHSLDFNLLV